MSKRFNLLLLQQPWDIHPRTWICVRGKIIKNTFRELTEEVLATRQWNKRKLNIELARHLKCSPSTIGMTLWTKRRFYPIPIILELAKYSKHKEIFLKKFRDNIEYLKVNSASARPVKAIYRINENLAKILGAFMADGSLSIQVVIASPVLADLDIIQNELNRFRINYSLGYVPSRRQHYLSIQASRNNFKRLNKIVTLSKALSQKHYALELSDEYKDSVMAFIKWIKDEFEINPNNFRKYRNAWRVSFSNKILARYLIVFFNAWPGLKSYYAFEPKIIRTSSLKIRTCFARGVLMFDGCVRIDKKITLTSKSKTLIHSVATIWTKDNIKFGTTKSKRISGYANGTNEYTVFTTTGNKKQRLLKYFEPGTQKWKLLKWLSGDSDALPFIRTKDGLSFKVLIKLLRKIKTCDAMFLKEYFGCSHSTIRTYLKVLRDQKKIRLSNHPKLINDYINENATILLEERVHRLVFKRIRRRFKYDKNFAKFLGLHKATISAWRRKKTRIPFKTLKRMCKTLDINRERILRNITKTDREIVEIIQ
ncbi:MAG: helix-turn-helix transcriptional regulator [bacterium]|nr:helix-turn-helix transcriptional regulator [bacterium]